MTHSVRDLLEQAVSDISPRDPDPVATIITRARRSRRHRNSAVASLIAAVGAIAGVAIVSGIAPTETPSGVHALPVMADVRGVSVVVPPNWQLRRDGVVRPCELTPMTFYVNVDVPREHQQCRFAAGPWAVLTPEDRIPLGVGLPPTSLLLPGGQPVWRTVSEQLVVADPTPLAILTSEPEQLRPPETERVSVTWVPWLDVKLVVAGSASHGLQIERSLVVPDAKSATGSLIVDNNRIVLVTAAGRVMTTPDADAGRAILAILAAARPVPPAEACAPRDEESVGLVLGSLTDDLEAMVVFGTGDCTQAVSSMGGRVQLSRGSVTKILDLAGTLPPRG